MNITKIEGQPIAQKAIYHVFGGLPVFPAWRGSQGHDSNAESVAGRAFRGVFRGLCPLKTRVLASGMPLIAP